MERANYSPKPSIQVDEWMGDIQKDHSPYSCYQSETDRVKLLHLGFLCSFKVTANVLQVLETGKWFKQ